MTSPVPLADPPHGGLYREQPHGVHRVGHHPGHHDRGRGRRGLRADRLTHPQAGGEVTALVADLHHRVLGIISTIASDAGYLVLIPLGAAAFKSVGRHPLAGMAAAFAGVAGGFGVNVLITPLDAVLTEITNESIHLAEPGRSIDLTANLWFGIASTVMLTFLLVFVPTRLAEPRLGAYDPALAPSGQEHQDEPDAFAGISPAADSRGLRWAGLALLGVIALN